MSQPASSDASVAMDGLTAGGEALIGMATLGKTAAALALILVIILGCSLLLKRLGGASGGQGRRPRVIGSTAVGNRERVVVVEIESTWLVLGVGGGQVSKLHELPAPAEEATMPVAGGADGSFASRFARALRQNAGLGPGPGGRR
ncbi:flagellar biosynthetic protein FliO [Halomonas nitroreducens]|uniref:Flagellar protein n=1 Tax=Halomonas nitroreducens TaxID=447425 RepID=A0A3S0JWQ6_9GAMM|nr:flagellar biosynthetic protein FliO [Halomonas nitroreducens]RTR04396.1 flagellar biosynthetic protein FliO [Halomonas nitroreducens]